jgi:hypothetical protein
MLKTFEDGTSNTIAIAEHYFFCDETQFFFIIDEFDGYPMDSSLRPPTFADGGPRP